MRLLTAEFVLHPFLGFVQRPAPVGPGWIGLHSFPINDLGFVDDKPSLVQRTPGRFIVAVTGGSVSLFLANDLAQTPGSSAPSRRRSIATTAAT